MSKRLHFENTCAEVSSTPMIGSMSVSSASNDASPASLLREGMLAADKMTAYRLAKLSGVTQGHISHVLAGSRPLTIEMAINFARALGEHGEPLREWAAHQIDVPLPRHPDAVTSVHRVELEEEEVEILDLGDTPCGSAREMEPTGRTYRVRARLAKGIDGASRAVGDSMTKAGIHDGDLLLVKLQDHAEPGQTVIVWSHWEGRTCKKLKLINGRLMLVPMSHNPEHMSFPLTDDVRVLGVVRWVDRQPLEME